MSVLDRAFTLLEGVAARGERCPIGDAIPGGSPSVSQLARDGRVFVEVYVRNFRRITILTGEHKGKATANPPLYAGKMPRPYLTVGRDGTRRNGVLIDTGFKSRNQPSKPRDFSGSAA